jgi:hypothetical protein
LGCNIQSWRRYTFFFVVLLADMAGVVCGILFCSYWLCVLLPASVARLLHWLLPCNIMSDEASRMQMVSTSVSSALHGKEEQTLTGTDMSSHDLYYYGFHYLSNQ